MVGHMKTNRICPIYEEEEVDVFDNNMDENLNSKSGTIWRNVSNGDENPISPFVFKIKKGDLPTSSQRELSLKGQQRRRRGAAAAQVALSNFLKKLELK